VGSAAVRAAAVRGAAVRAVAVRLAAVVGRDNEAKPICGRGFDR
jgi:hypothetical protein